METYIKNLLEFVIKRCNVNRVDSIELINACEDDLIKNDDSVVTMVYGNLLSINQAYLPDIRKLIKEVYGEHCKHLLQEINEYAYQKFLLSLDVNQEEY